MNKLSVGLITNSYVIANWQSKALNSIIGSSYADLTLVVVPEAPVKDPNQRIEESLFYRVYQRLEKTKLKRPPTARRTVDLSKTLSALPVVKIKPGQNQKQIPAEQLDSIKEFNLDVLIDFSSLTLPDELYEIPKYGVWYLTFCGSREAPAGFWEVLKGLSYTTSELVMQSGPQPQIVIQSFSQVVPFSVKRTAEFNYWKSASFIPRMMRLLYEKGPEGFKQQVMMPDRVEKNKGYRFPKGIYVLALIADFCKKYLHEKIFNRFYSEQWILLYQINDQYSDAFGDYKRLVPPKNRFWADPFIYQKDQEYYIFLEESLMGKQKKGFISVMTMDQLGNFNEPQKIIEQPYHMSYPFLFEWQDELYMLPESNASGTIQLYKCQEFPHKWEFHKNLMKEILAVDSTLLFHQNKWWLFANISENPGSSTWDELFLFSADSPLSDHWRPHPLNPLVSDLRGARPAGGIIQRDGKIYRPAQNCAVRYGYGLKMYEIVTLSETDYKEVEVASYEPLWDPQIRGFHTINREGKLTLIDGILRESKFF
ncbi:MAG: hypothetical protein OER04_01755 [Cyclobacteriaceae bacterium]|nr:hypothetical protein [Cyclobacteriaceae bacterium]